MSHLLLDVNIVVDLCVARAGSPNSLAAVALAGEQGFQLWVYAGSVQTLEYVVASELRYARQKVGDTLSGNAARQLARQVLGEITTNYQWLAALATDGAVFADEDPEDAQLIRSLERFTAGTARLLTRDGRVLERCGDVAITPEAFIEQSLQHPGKPKFEFIDLKTQQNAIRPQLEQNIHRVLHHGTYIMGNEVDLLEAKLAAYTGAKHCITVASGTEALLISLMALGIGAGDEVITTPFTFVATAEVIVLLGAKPVFVDIEPDTCNIDARLIEVKITERTKAIMPVSLYGQPADMDEINAIAAKYNLPVIEDAAQSFGATYKGKKSCNLSTIGCTSFFPSKPLGCYGDGGAIFTDDDNIYQACREIRIHGQSRRYYHTRVGVGGRMDTLQCAIVLAKLERFDLEVEQRIALGQRYNQLMDEAGVQRVQQRDDRTSVFAQYTVLVEKRSEVEARFKEVGIPTAVHYPVPLNEQPTYQHLCCADCTPIAKDRAQRVMSLPMGADLSSIHQKTITNVLVKLDA
ncbi:aminotransferase class I/II-fold pyridoxal phosphate-dependent enzyme [Thiothrix sp.]|jgi:UDP-2-acetamido-2-deoxy-ribo-hexuluronate aminotransferase|uniref:aminotransferase class I/II-fold pyridoxal phosphate-dependent enzyme n=1 Tax=Thiothrix sp. TaxID=1032 RepID=UPI00257B3C80|nr:aminotransferase class I/II-fold pyridoxal phosphate-dependent enzyme [Thiothrix sp.]